ncbi:MAG: SUF system NifU family Fe-S cluster assembly protein [Candidatus Hydrogenedens sp.]|nr:SUF system NifU family Fe-S cluster assembly protein [Candidatus Hydrogenedens sp.]
MPRMDRKEQEALIIDHNRRPRNYGKLDDADCRMVAFNPLCGDRYEIFLRLDDVGRIAQANFTGDGCAVSKAAASVMTEVLPGKTEVEAAALFEAFRAMITSEPDSPFDAEGLGTLAVFAGVRNFPIRIKCATLPWRAALAALHGDQGEVSAVE